MGGVDRLWDRHGQTVGPADACPQGADAQDREPMHREPMHRLLWRRCTDDGACWWVADGGAYGVLVLWGASEGLVGGE